MTLSVTPYRRSYMQPRYPHTGVGLGRVSKLGFAVVFQQGGPSDPGQKMGYSLSVTDVRRTMPLLTPTSPNYKVRRDSLHRGKPPPVKETLSLLTLGICRSYVSSTPTHVVGIFFSYPPRDRYRYVIRGGLPLFTNLT